jgi:hypothetical protein
MAREAGGDTTAAETDLSLSMRIEGSPGAGIRSGLERKPGRIGVAGAGPPPQRMSCGSDEAGLPPGDACPQHVAPGQEGPQQQLGFVQAAARDARSFQARRTKGRSSGAVAQ